MDMLNIDKLVEVYARVLRKQQKYKERYIFLVNLLRKMSLINPRLARVLAELSLILRELDKATCSKERL